MYLGFDPGKDKCGVAVVSSAGEPVWHEVVAAAQVIEQLGQLQQTYAVNRIVMGDQTASKRWKNNLQQAFPTIDIVQVDERYSSLEARDRYWQMYPARGLRQLLPPGLRQPPRPVDDLVAIILVERYLAKQNPTMA